jgi:hypothetical protein
MIATIFHDSPNSQYPDMVCVSGTTLDELRKNSIAEVEKRGWKQDDCWSQVYGNDKEIAELA